MIARPVTAQETADLRRQVLRGGRPVALPGDEEPAYHVGVVTDEGVIATGNVRPEPPPWNPGAVGWRIRGMATAEGHRGLGLGTRVLEALLAHCRSAGGGIVWCNARTPARALYERAGLQVIGDPWDDPEIGPHVRMWSQL